MNEVTKKIKKLYKLNKILALLNKQQTTLKKEIESLINNNNLEGKI